MRKNAAKGNVWGVGLLLLDYSAADCDPSWSGRTDHGMAKLGERPGDRLPDRMIGRDLPQTMAESERNALLAAGNEARVLVHHSRWAIGGGHHP